MKVESVNDIFFASVHFGGAVQRLKDVDNLFEDKLAAFGSMSLAIARIRTGVKQLQRFIEANRYRNGAKMTEFKLQAGMLAGNIEGYLKWYDETFMPLIVFDQYFDHYALDRRKAFIDNKDRIKEVIPALEKYQKLFDEFSEQKEDDEE